MQKLIIDFVDAYRVEKIKICEMDVKQVKSLYQSDPIAAKLLAVEKKINLGLFSSAAINEVLNSVSINLSTNVTLPNGNIVSKLDLVKLLLLTDIDKLVVSHFESELKGTIY